ncbi:MAG: 30S ribosomal protein S20 [Patescibacteria group bacterium]
MPIQKAAFKDLRQAKKRRARNLTVINAIKKMSVAFRQSCEKKDKAKAGELAKKLIKAYDKAASNGYLKKNTAGRKKSRLSKKLNALLKS